MEGVSVISEGFGAAPAHGGKCPVAIQTVPLHRESKPFSMGDTWTADEWLCILISCGNMYMTLSVVQKLRGLAQIRGNVEPALNYAIRINLVAEMTLRVLIIYYFAGC